jgi:hypothetical protein
MMKIIVSCRTLRGLAKDGVHYLGLHEASPCSASLYPRLISAARVRGLSAHNIDIYSVIAKRYRKPL